MIPKRCLYFNHTSQKWATEKTRVLPVGSNKRRDCFLLGVFSRGNLRRISPILPPRAHPLRGSDAVHVVAGLVDVVSQRHVCCSNMCYVTSSTRNAPLKKREKLAWLDLYCFLLIKATWGKKIEKQQLKFCKNFDMAWSRSSQGVCDQSMESFCRLRPFSYWRQITAQQWEKRLAAW